MFREVVVRVKVPPHYIGRVEEVRLVYAIDLFLRRIFSVERAAELAGIQLHDFLIELRKRRVKAYPYNDEGLGEELRIE